jgi:hypothetical protein
MVSATNSSRFNPRMAARSYFKILSRQIRMKAIRTKAQ